MSDNVADQNPGIFTPLDNDLNEVYVWHGTNVRAALSIAQDDFSINKAGEGSGTMYGLGAYFAESSTKVDQQSETKTHGQCTNTNSYFIEVLPAN